MVLLCFALCFYHERHWNSVMHLPIFFWVASLVWLRLHSVDGSFFAKTCGNQMYNRSIRCTNDQNTEQLEFILKRTNALLWRWRMLTAPTPVMQLPLQALSVIIMCSMAWPWSTLVPRGNWKNTIENYDLHINRHIIAMIDKIPMLVLL